MEHQKGLSIAGLFFLIFVISGCSSSPKYSHHGSPSSTGKSSKVLKIARSMLGAPYHYGGRHPDTGFDCSGLVYYSHLQAGKKLPRTSYAQFKSSQPIPRRKLRPGDLVFFRIHRNKISHVGIYLGESRFIHAPSSGKEVTIGSMENPYWQKRFVRGGRVF